MSRAMGPRAQLLLIAGLFVVPVLAAWLVVFSGWRPAGSTNHGQLLEPPVQTATEGWRTPAGGATGPVLMGYWTALAVAPEGCGTGCQELIDRLRRVRLALNDDAARVQVALALGPGADPPDLPWLTVVHIPGPQLAELAADAAGESTGLLVVDFRGYRMMTYPLPLDGEGLLDDLERLLRASSEDVENFERRRAAEAGAAPRSLSDLGVRREPSGRARPVFRSFEENSRRYLTKRIGEMDRYPTGAVGAA